jgi:hypothetical protein
MVAAVIGFLVTQGSNATNASLGQIDESSAVNPASASLPVEPPNVRSAHHNETLPVTQEATAVLEAGNQLGREELVADAAQVAHEQAESVTATQQTDEQVSFQAAFAAGQHHRRQFELSSENNVAVDPVALGETASAILANYADVTATSCRDYACLVSVRFKDEGALSEGQTALLLGSDQLTRGALMLFPNNEEDWLSTDMYIFFNADEVSP